MNKVLKVILNVLTGAAAVVFLVCLVDLISSVRYANREAEDPVKTYAGVFEYELEHRAYGEIMGDYYVRRMKNFDPPAGYEDLYRVGEFAHTAFMGRVYDEKGDKDKAGECRSKIEKLRGEMGGYGYTADEIEGMLNDRTDL